MPLHSCVALWDVTGMPTWAAEFEAPFWMSIDLVGMPMTLDDGQYGNCEGMSTIFGDVRGAMESLEDFIDSQDLAFGIHSLADVSPTVVSRWSMLWKARAPAGPFSWNSLEDSMAAGAFSSSLSEWTPVDVGVVVAYEIDSSNWTFSRAPLDVSRAETLPTGFYDLVAMSSYGTAF